MNSLRTDSTGSAITSPAAFAAAVLACVVKGLADDSTKVEDVQKSLDELTATYVGRVPTVVLKAVPSRQMMYGWASVVTKDGTPVEDRQGDVMDIDNVRTVVHKFMADRSTDAMHTRDESGQIVDSFVWDAETQKAFGVNFGCEGWMVGVKFHDAGVWKRVESGELRALSIDADGFRSPLKD